jgi:hypothetical protein
MAAELATGALVMYQIQEWTRKYLMLVNNKVISPKKKATGIITFECKDGH